MPLPKWLNRAIKEQVVSEQEAKEIHQISLQSDQELVELPEHLWSAAERIDLWETPVEEMGRA
jgi:hypothetical protein